jgi:hypothetical protein
MTQTTNTEFHARFFLVQGRGDTMETGNCNATAISEKNRRLQAGNWFPD